MNMLLLESLSPKQQNQELGTFIRRNIADFQGKIVEGYPIPRTLFAREDSAFLFVNKVAKSLGIPRAFFIVVTATSE